MWASFSTGPNDSPIVWRKCKSALNANAKHENMEGLHRVVPIFFSVFMRPHADRVFTSLQWIEKFFLNFFASEIYVDVSERQPSTSAPQHRHVHLDASTVQCDPRLFNLRTN